MSKSSLLKLGLLLMLPTAFYSCKKTNGINNNDVIKTPYGLFVSDTGGNIYNSNDGVQFSLLSGIGADGARTRNILVADTNLLFIKTSNTSLSMDVLLRINNDRNVNASYGYASPAGTEQSMMIYAADEQRVYLANLPGPTGGQMSIVYSDEDGYFNSFKVDQGVDSSSVRTPANVTSFAQLKNNIIVAIDPQLNRIFAKYDKGSKWIEVDSLKPVNNKLPFGGNFTLGHYNNTVVAIDRSGINGAWYSFDTGKTWAAYTGLPAGRPLLCVASPFDQTLMVGTDSAGLFVLNTNTGVFVPSLLGLNNNFTSVRGIIGKQNVFKNNDQQQYIYLATSTGIYQSVDGGQNWVSAKGGSYDNIY